MDIAPRLAAEWFRSSRTLRAAERVRESLEKFDDLAVRDFHAGVQAALYEITAGLCDRIGQANMARELRRQQGELVAKINQTLMQRAARRDARVKKKKEEPAKEEKVA